MAERTIRHAFARYKVKLDDGRIQRKTAWQGETVDLPPDEEVRLEGAGALAPEGTEAETAPGTPDPATATVVELAAWINGTNPTVPEVIAAAGDDPVKAAKLLDAESEATGGDPRRGVEDGLQKIIDDAA